MALIKSFHCAVLITEVWDPLFFVCIKIDGGAALGPEIRLNFAALVPFDWKHEEGNSRLVKTLRQSLHAGLNEPPHKPFPLRGPALFLSLKWLSAPWRSVHAFAASRTLVPCKPQAFTGFSQETFLLLVELRRMATFSSHSSWMAFYDGPELIADVPRKVRLWRQKRKKYDASISNMFLLFFLFMAPVTQEPLELS